MAVNHFDMPEIVQRYLPRDYDIERMGHPPIIDVLTQWEIRHRGCVFLARDAFLDQSMPKTAQERIEKWYECQALVECAVRAFEDLQVILEWYGETWCHPTITRFAMKENGVRECDGRCSIPVLHRVAPGIAALTALFFCPT